MSAIASTASTGRDASRVTRRLDLVERPTVAVSGLVMLGAALACIVAGGALVYSGMSPAIHPAGGFGTVMPYFYRIGVGLVVALLGVVSLGGLTVVAPNVAVVTTFFGRYTGTLHRNGFWWINPFCKTQEVSMALQAIENKPIKVNDLNGNPIEIGAVVTWGVEDAARAIFGVTDYEEYVALQVETAIRTIATRHPYETFDTIGKDSKVVPPEKGVDVPVALRGHSEELSAELAGLIDGACAPAGIVVDKVRISHLAYAPEIAPIMLRRQAVAALSQARKAMVDNVMAIVRSAVDDIENPSDGKPGIALDPERKAAFACAIATVLCSEKEATPVLNVGSLYGV